LVKNADASSCEHGADVEKEVEKMVRKERVEDAFDEATGTWTQRTIVEMVPEVVKVYEAGPKLAPGSPERDACLAKLNSEPNKAINYNDVIAILTMTVQYQYTDLRALKAVVDDHESRLSVTERRVDRLEDLQKQAAETSVTSTATTQESESGSVALKAGESDGSKEEGDHITDKHFDERIKTLEQELMRLKATRTAPGLTESASNLTNRSGKSQETQAVAEAEQVYV
jgi:hypothetical protein